MTKQKFMKALFGLKAEKELQIDQLKARIVELEAEVARLTPKKVELKCPMHGKPGCACG